MKLILSSFYLLFCISLAEAFFFFWWSKETTTTTSIQTTWEVLPQDDTDAKTIIDDGKSEKVFASILPYREKIRRMTIIRQIGVHSGGVDYIADNYVPQQAGNPTFNDLVYGLGKHESMVLGGYLEVFFESQDETLIIIAMVLTKNMQEMITTYDSHHSPKTFKDLRKKQRSPFENLLRVWVRQNRNPTDNCYLDKNSVTQDVNALRYDYDTDGWKENRDQLETILIVKSFKYAQAVIEEFEKAMGKSLEDLIMAKSSSDELNHDLADAYASLSKYIKNKPKYIIDIMHQYSDGSDKWAVWIMCIAVVTPKEWPQIEEAFQKDYKDSLSNFILKKMTDDKVMAEMIAVIVDPKFKPTTFAEKPVQGGSGSNTTLPPASPTTVVPPPPNSPTTPAPP